MLERIVHYYTKIKQIGLVRFYCAARARIKKSYFSKKMIPTVLPPISSFSLQSLPFTHTISMQRDDLLQYADAYACNQFSFLGSDPKRYTHMPWYSDVRLQQNEHDSFDIKVPWELARFQYAPILAYAYKQTKSDLYVSALKQQIISFLDAAPYLHGIHWSNPMEVAIRATNWIVAYQIVRDELQQDMPFHDRLVQSLWQHMHFIENNWEWYDGRTNNHYLSNLVGYAYLNWFFNDQKRFNYCFTQLCNELEWQIQDDGSSYEGSTAYHGFVTELFLHGFLIAQQMGKSITPAIHATLDRMLKFAKDTKGLRIGDDDSGSLLHAGLYHREILWNYLNFFDFCHVENYGSCNNTNLYKPFVLSLSKDTNDQNIFRSNGSTGSPRTVLNYCIFSQLKCHFGLGMQLSIFNSISHYPDFGLSIIDHEPWKISLRHHAYHGRQPSAHFHEDVASITLTYNGRPILVDPGTYLYTGSKEWRNYFRSAAQHSTFYPVGWNQKKNDDLFALEISEADAQYERGTRSIRTMHSLFGYPVSRTVQWSERELLIQDDVSHASDQMEWQLLCAPELTVQKSAAGWHIMQGDDCLLQMECDELVFEKRAAWASPAYGVKELAWALWARGKKNIHQVTIRFKRETV